MSFGVIYCTTNLINGKKYIGQTTLSGDDYVGSGINITRAIEKYGKENFQKEILQDCVDRDDLNESEKYWIEYFGAVTSDLFYNIAPGGAAFRAGAKLSEETKRRISTSNIGRVQSLETRLAIGRGNRGKGRKRIHPVVIRKPREQFLAECRRAINQYDLDGNLIATFESATHAAKVLDLLQNAICKVASKSNRTAYGFIWKYVEEKTY